MQVDLNHPVIAELRRREIAFEVRGQVVVISRVGKTGEIILKMGVGEVLEAHSRYDRIQLIHCFRDLVDDVWYWLGVTAAKNGGTYEVFPEWRQAFIDHDYMDKDMTTYLRWVEREKERAHA